jgi:hypothetical protein
MMWIKFMTFLKITKTFGYMIKVIEIMMKSAISFFAVFIIFLLAYATIMKDYFRDANPDKWGNFWLSIRTLLLNSYGQVNFKGYTKYEAEASFLTIIFGIISIVLMLNLLIAILSNIFVTIHKRGAMESSIILF